MEKKAGNRGKGRPKGCKNKTTLAVKEAIILAFDEAGGVEALVKFAKKYPTHFYTQIWAKLLPQEINAAITGKDGIPLITEVVVVHHKPPAATGDTPVGDGAITGGQESTSAEHAPRPIEGVGV